MLKENFAWMEISTDGLLKYPAKMGPYYDEVDVNNFGGFDSEQDAVKHMINLKEAGNFLCGRFILVKSYEFVK